MTRALKPRTAGRHTAQCGPDMRKVIHLGRVARWRGHITIAELECGHAKEFIASESPEVGHYTRCAVCAR